MRHRFATTLAGLLSASVLAWPAAADTQEFADTTGTVGPMDISQVTVENEDQLVVRIKVDDLQRQTGRSVTLWVDAKPRKAGPDFVVASGLFDSDWQISRARNWRIVGNGPLACYIGQHLNYDDDIIRFTTGRDCLGNYSRIRVSVTTRDEDGNVDHSPARRTLHPWVARN